MITKYRRQFRQPMPITEQQYRQAQCEQAKNHWLAAHPEATQAQIEAAMRAIAEEHKI